MIHNISFRQHLILTLPKSLPPNATCNNLKQSHTHNTKKSRKKEISLIQGWLLKCHPFTKDNCFGLLLAQMSNCHLSVTILSLEHHQNV